MSNLSLPPSRLARRRLCAALAALPAGALLAVSGPVAAQGGLAAISNVDAGRALKTALEKGADVAVRLLGAPDGFLGNPQVRIPLPGYLEDIARMLRAIGRRQQVEELEIAMNRAAEAAVPLARKLLTDAVRRMSVADAKKILTGGDTAVTGFFAEKTRLPLAEAFLPVVKQQTAKVALAEKLDRVAAKAAAAGLVNKEDASIDHYVTRKALDGLYFMIGEQERQIRQDPVGTGSALLGKVFGALR